jgi:hypothetical protein
MFIILYCKSLQKTLKKNKFKHKKDRCLFGMGFTVMSIIKFDTKKSRTHSKQKQKLQTCFKCGMKGLTKFKGLSMISKM